MQSLAINFSKRLFRTQRLLFSSKPISNTCNEVVSKTISENHALSEPLSEPSPIKKSSIIEEKNSNPLPILKHTVNYPWLMSYQQPRIPAPSFLTSFKNKQLLKSGLKRAQMHLQEPAYHFPEDFYADTKMSIRNLFKLLSTPSALTLNDVNPLMTRSLSDYILPAHNELIKRGGRLEYVPPTSYTLDTVPISIKLKIINFTYGPYPAPAGSVAQTWHSFLTLVIPEERAVFKSYAEQKDIMNIAMDQGVYMRIDTKVTLPIQIVIYDEAGNPVIVDKRKNLDIQFVSPHFTTTDEIFTMQADGTWKLAWDWRVSDIDYLVLSNAKDVEIGSGDRSLRIDWGFSSKDKRLKEANAMVEERLDNVKKIE